jgi:hypothetical protein
VPANRIDHGDRGSETRRPPIGRPVDDRRWHSFGEEDVPQQVTMDHLRWRLHATERGREALEHRIDR